jgi:hypothetical protein
METGTPSAPAAIPSRYRRSAKDLSRETRMELAKFAAIQGLGWEDITVEFGLQPSEAQALVFGERP